MYKESYGRVRQEKKIKVFLARLSPVSLSVFSLVPDLLSDCSRVLEYAKIRTVLQQSFTSLTLILKKYNPVFLQLTINQSIIYFNTLRQRAKNSFKIRTCINKIYNNYSYIILFNFKNNSINIYI